MNWIKLSAWCYTISLLYNSNEIFWQETSEEWQRGNTIKLQHCFIMLIIDWKLPVPDIRIQFRNGWPPILTLHILLENYCHRCYKCNRTFDASLANNTTFNNTTFKPTSAIYASYLYLNSNITQKYKWIQKKSC